MVVCMPKWALRRTHAKHPCGLYKFNCARKLLNQQLEQLNIQFNRFSASKEFALECLGSRFEWLRPDKTCTQQQNLCAIKESIRDELETLITSFAALRSLQREVNKIRKSLMDQEAEDICCCKKILLFREMNSLLDIIVVNSINAFNCKSVAVKSSLCDNKVVTFERRDSFWNQVRTLDPEEVQQIDYTVFLFQNMMKAQYRCDKLEAVEAFVAYLCTDSEGFDRFEPRKICLVFEQFSLYQELYVCALEMGTENMDEWNFDGCATEDCALHAFIKNLSLPGTFLPRIKEDNFELLLDLASSSLLTSSIELVSLTQLTAAIVRYLEAACDLYSIDLPIIYEIIDWLDNACIGGIDQSYEVEQNDNTEDHDGRLSGPQRLDEANKTSKPAVQASGNDGNEFTNSQPQESFDQLKRAHNSDSNAVTPRSASQCDSRKRHRSESRHFPNASTCKTVSRYYQRGCCRTTSKVHQPKLTVDANIHQRIWRIQNPTHYQSVWRVIFPLSRQDRQISRVSWPLFLQAIQASPVSCRIKKANGVVFIFERHNENGGREIFQCHAPHQMDWICQGDLYRYRKDLRDTFGMDAERIMLEGAIVDGQRS